MQRRFPFLCGAVWVALAMTAPAQEGHPLVGSWHGDWGIAGAARQDLSVVIDYIADGSDVAGIANPGYDHAALQKIHLTVPMPTDWHETFEAELKDKAG